MRVWAYGQAATGVTLCDPLGSGEALLGGGVNPGPLSSLGGVDQKTNAAILEGV